MSKESMVDMPSRKAALIVIEHMLMMLTLHGLRPHLFARKDPNHALTFRDAAFHDFGLFCKGLIHQQVHTSLCGNVWKFHCTPASGTPITGKGVIICQYPSDPTVALGCFAVIALFLSAGFGLISVFYPYKGKSIPKEALFRNTTSVVFFIVAVGVTVLAEVLLMWATITEGLHIARNVHHDLSYQCPTAKTGLFGGAGFLALDASLFWLICQMLALNARADYLEEDDPKGEYGEVLATEYVARRVKP